jgi:transposase
VVRSGPRAELAPRSLLLADKDYYSNSPRGLVAHLNAFANIVPKCNREDPICFGNHLYRARNCVERFFNKIEHYRCIATRYVETAEIFRAALKVLDA